jgi:hypothetical protein
MYQKMHKLIPVAGLLTSLAAATDAFAGTNGGTITYGPPTQSIPALSDLMLVVLGLLLAVMAYRVLRAHPGGGQPLASLVALAIVGLSMIPGGKLIEEAYANAGYEMTSPSGGTVFIPSGLEYPVGNSSGVVQQIKSVTPTTGVSSWPTTGTPTCTPGLTVQPNSSCYVFFTSGPT